MPADLGAIVAQKASEYSGLAVFAVLLKASEIVGKTLIGRKKERNSELQTTLEYAAKLREEEEGLRKHLQELVEDKDEEISDRTKALTRAELATARLRRRNVELVDEIAELRMEVRRCGGKLPSPLKFDSDHGDDD
jgi:chromosome segregation ATPase